MKPSASSKTIQRLEDEIGRIRQEASTTIRDLQSHTSEQIQREVREKLLKGLERIEHAAERSAEAAKRQSTKWKERLGRTDRRRMFYLAGGILAAGSAASILMGRKRRRRSMLPAERGHLDVTKTSGILEEAHQEGSRESRRHAIVPPAEEEYLEKTAHAEEQYASRERT
jgi:hypothetical protein